MIKIEPDKVQAMHLADIVHQLELACYQGHPMFQYREIFETILIEVIKETKHERDQAKM